MPDWLPILRWLDLLDIALVTGFGWLTIHHFRRARARSAFVGLVILGVVYFLARTLDLRLTAALFQGFFAVVVIVLVVVFQDDLRRAFEQLGSWRWSSAHVPARSEVVDLLVRTTARLQSTRTGALIVLPGDESLDRHIEGGIALGGRVSEALLLSLFDASSPGHDGAVVLRGSVVERFATHLPLSANHAALRGRGTRHAAALGLSERCDAICIVVSEEQGTIGVARDGQLNLLDQPQDLIAQLRDVYQQNVEVTRWWSKRPSLDVVVALLSALALWLVFVPGSESSEATVAATVAVTNLPADLELESVEPPTVDVTLRGLRRDLVLAQRNQLSVEVDAYLARLGRRTFSISTQGIRKPSGVSIVGFEPGKVVISLRPTADSKGRAE